MRLSGSTFVVQAAVALTIALTMAPGVRTVTAELNSTVGRVWPFSMVRCHMPTTPVCVVAVCRTGVATPGRAPMSERRMAWSWDSLDPVSWRVVGWFLIRIYSLAALALLPCLTGTQSLQDAVGLMSFVSGCGAVVSTTFARMRREVFAQGSLNGWDEALRGWPMAVREGLLLYVGVICFANFVWLCFGGAPWWR